MSAQHTPGPWEVHTERSSGSGQPWIFQTAKGGGCERTVFDGDAVDVWPLREANAALIAAAPDLLAALEAAESELERMEAATGHPCDGAAMGQIRAAITKATA